MEEITHSDACESASVRKKCKECKSKYRSDSRKLRIQLKADQIVQTRNVTTKKRSKFYDILCDNCKGKERESFVPNVDVTMKRLQANIIVTQLNFSKGRPDLTKLNNQI